MPDDNRPASGMPSARVYRQKAVELGALANKSTDPFIRTELESLAVVYMRLAEKAEQMVASPDSGIKPGVGRQDPST